MIAIRAWLGQFSEILGERDILERFENAWADYQSSPASA